MLIIGGATATGKSHAAIMLAKLSGGEIVSADSMQIYKHMNIGTAKITAAETQGVPHHMIDIVEPTQEYSVAEYQKAALEIIKDIKSRGKIPIVVGGTGLYINALIYPLRFGGVKKDECLRNELKEQGERFGYDFLYDKLCSIDAESAKKIHKNKCDGFVFATFCIGKIDRCFTHDFEKHRHFGRDVSNFAGDFDMYGLNVENA